MKKLLRFSAVTVLSLSSLLGLAMPLVHATAQTCTWTGTAGDNKFSTATNWSACGSGAPLAGDIISFGQSSSQATINLTNDLGVSLGGVVSTATTTDSMYKIDTISVLGGSKLDAQTGLACSQGVANMSYGTINAAGDLTINANASNLWNTTLNVAGNLTMENLSGYGILSPSAGSTVGGGLTLSSPYNLYSTTCNSGGSGGLPSGSSITGFTIHSLTVQKGASVNLADSSFPITLGGGTGTGDPYLNYAANWDSNINSYVATTYVNSSAITLLSNAVISASDKTDVSLTGAFSGTGFKLTADPSSTGKLSFNPSSNSTDTTAGVQQNPVVTTTIASSDSQPTLGVNVVPNETLVLDGTRDWVNVLTGATLLGSGTIAGNLYVADGAIVAPGHSPGCLTVGAGFSLSGTYQVDVGGTTACTGYDQIKVTGVVSLDSTNSVLQATLYNGFVPKVGESYTIIDNDAADPVSGTFSGITEGGTYVNQGVTYTVTYIGGDGNDVVLTVTAVDASKLPAKPNTGFALVAAHPLVTLGTSILAAAALIVASRKLKVSKN